MVKKGAALAAEKALAGEVGVGIAVQPESGADAAVERLSKPKAENMKPAYKQRDFDAEARGKTRCAMFAAALQSPALAGLRFETAEEFLVIVKKAAEAGVGYSFGE